MLLRHETERAVVQFAVNLTGALVMLAIYYNYVVLQAYFYSLLWAVVCSLPLFHVKQAVLRLLPHTQNNFRQKNKTTSLHYDHHRNNGGGGGLPFTTTTTTATTTGGRASSHTVPPHHKNPKTLKNPNNTTTTTTIRLCPNDTTTTTTTTNTLRGPSKRRLTSLLPTGLDDDPFDLPLDDLEKNNISSFSYHNGPSSNNTTSNRNNTRRRFNYPTAQQQPAAAAAAAVLSSTTPPPPPPIRSFLSSFQRAATIPFLSSCCLNATTMVAATTALLAGRRATTIIQTTHSSSPSTKHSLHHPVGCAVNVSKSPTTTKLGVPGEIGVVVGGKETTKEENKHLQGVTKCGQQHLQEDNSTTTLLVDALWGGSVLLWDAFAFTVRPVVQLLQPKTARRYSYKTSDDAGGGRYAATSFTTSQGEDICMGFAPPTIPTKNQPIPSPTTSAPAGPNLLKPPNRDDATPSTDRRERGALGGAGGGYEWAAAPVALERVSKYTAGGHRGADDGNFHAVWKPLDRHLLGLVSPRPCALRRSTQAHPRRGSAPHVWRRSDGDEKEREWKCGFMEEKQGYAGGVAGVVAAEQGGGLVRDVIDLNLASDDAGVACVLESLGRGDKCSNVAAVSESWVSALSAPSLPLTPPSSLASPMHLSPRTQSRAQLTGTADSLRYTTPYATPPFSEHQPDDCSSGTSRRSHCSSASVALRLVPRACCASEPYFGLLYRWGALLLARRVYRSSASFFASLLLLPPAVLAARVVFRRFPPADLLADRLRESPACHRAARNARAFAARRSSEAVVVLLPVLLMISFIFITSLIGAFFVFQFYQESVMIWDHAQAYVRSHITDIYYESESAIFLRKQIEPYLYSVKKGRKPRKNNDTINSFATGSSTPSPATSTTTMNSLSSSSGVSSSPLQFSAQFSFGGAPGVAPVSAAGRWTGRKSQRLARSNSERTPRDHAHAAPSTGRAEKGAYEVSEDASTREGVGEVGNIGEEEEEETATTLLSSLTEVIGEQRYEQLLDLFHIYKNQTLFGIELEQYSELWRALVEIFEPPNHHSYVPSGSRADGQGPASSAAPSPTSDSSFGCFTTSEAREGTVNPPGVWGSAGCSRLPVRVPPTLQGGVCSAEYNSPLHGPQCLFIPLNPRFSRSVTADAAKDERRGGLSLFPPGSADVEGGEGGSSDWADPGGFKSAFWRSNPASAELITQLKRGNILSGLTLVRQAWGELCESVLAGTTSEVAESWKSAKEYAHAGITGLMGSGLSLFRVVLISLVLVFKFFLSAFDMMLQAVVFLSGLYYLLCSEISFLHYVEEIVGMVDPTGIVFTSIERGLRAILLSSAKRMFFYSLFIWVSLSWFDLPLVFVPTALAALAALLPIAPPEIIALPAFAYLWLLEGRLAAATALAAIHCFVYWHVTTAIYKEIPDSNPWLVGLSVVLGISTFGLKGIIIGPLLASIPLILYNIASKYNEQRRRDQRRRLRRSRRQRAHAAEQVY